MPFIPDGIETPVAQPYSPGRVQQQITACVLVPHVTVTPEFTALEAGQHSLWTAIEISGQLSEVAPASSSTGDGEKLDNLTNPFSLNKREGLFEFGCLYDLTVEVLAATNTTVLQVLSEQAFPTTICAKSSLLLLAQIQVAVEEVPQTRTKGHVRQKSDDLIEDLEVELGDTQLEYIHIRISYSHSAFPEQTDIGSVGGVSAIQSKVETTATATLKLHNTFSPWSPPPTPAPNPLFQLAKQHWGTGKTPGIIQPSLYHDSTSENPRKLPRGWTKAATNDVDDLSSGNAIATVPVRHVSHQQERPVKEAGSAEGSRVESANKAPVSTMRGRRHFNRVSDSPVPPQPGGVDQPRTSSYQAPQGDDQAQSSWKRRSFGTDTIRGLLPLMMGDLSMSCEDHQPSDTSQTEVGRFKSKKEGNRWSWGAWF